VVLRWTEAPVLLFIPAQLAGGVDGTRAKEQIERVLFDNVKSVCNAFSSLLRVAIKIDKVAGRRDGSLSPNNRFHDRRITMGLELQTLYDPA
jgi:hypothetical protein